VKQFILNAKPDRDNVVRLKGDDFRYLVRVRRLAVGEFFPAVLPDGEETIIKILSVDGGVLTGKCSASVDASSSKTLLSDGAPPEKLPPIILFQALTKGDKMDLIVRQAAEGGITEIVPFVSEFSVAKTDSGGQKFSRWERIVREARQQSGSGTATAIRRPLKKDEVFEYWKKIKEKEGCTQHGAAGLLFHHMSLGQGSLHSYLNDAPKIVALAIGPEGGFSSTEVSLFLENGFKPIKIGDTILRTETAALYCAAAIKILLLERDLWELKQVKKNNA
jgi:16S rRNA (uracil1498-N3)-methyltransferase